MEGMKGMDSAGGTQGMAMPGIQMMPMMRAHMDSMMGRSPAEMQNMMARHQDLMSQMLDGMGTDMRGMNMTGDSAWTALTDSVKRDLAELPGLEGQALEQRMRGHSERVGRLLAMHERMMRM
jgi:phage-related minor tail protein